LRSGVSASAPHSSRKRIVRLSAESSYASFEVSMYGGIISLMEVSLLSDEDRDK